MNGYQQKSKKFREQYDGKWMFSLSKTEFEGEPYDSMEEAIVAGNLEFNRDDSVECFYVAQVDLIYPNSLFSSREILDQIQKNAEAKGGELAKNRMIPTKFAESRLMVVISAFLDENFIFDYHGMYNLTEISNRPKSKD